MEDRKALNLVEAARDAEGASGFAAGLFMGRAEFDRLLPFAESPDPAQDAPTELIEKVRAFLSEHVDPDEIDRRSEIPDSVIRGLRELGLFGMRIPARYGGLGLSQFAYNRVIHLVASHCASTAVLLSAHQSIGAPKPLLMFGTDEQKERYLPRLAAGALSAFALTEPGVGSDPSRMTTTATPVEDGAAYLINGEKLWISNGPLAEILIVMARTPDPDRPGKSVISAFLVESKEPGFEVAHRCRFLGLRGIENGLLRFRDLRVPREGLLGQPGRGMKIALTTLNTGRLTLPAASAAVAKQCMSLLRPWIEERVQWGRSIGRHEAVAGRVARLAAHTYALDALWQSTSLMTDSEGTDIRVEAAMAKLFSSESLWQRVDETLQNRGGRGYETAESLRARGEPPLPVERLLRDARINRIIEGTSDIMRLFIAREAIEPHLKATGMSATGGGGRLGRALRFYLIWYPALWLPGTGGRFPGLPRRLQTHRKRIEKETRRLARTLFHAMIRHRRGLQDRQRLLERIVDIGTGLFVMAVTLARAAAEGRSRPDDGRPAELADTFCYMTWARIETLRRELRRNQDPAETRLAIDVLEGRYRWLEDHIIPLVIPEKKSS